MIADDEPIMKVLANDIPIVFLSLVQFCIFATAVCLVGPSLARLAGGECPWLARHFWVAVVAWLPVVAGLCRLGRRLGVQSAAFVAMLVHLVATAYVLQRPFS
jgi:hypothetical protein